MRRPARPPYDRNRRRSSGSRSSRSRAFLGHRGCQPVLIEELTSRGYIVVTLDQPGTAAATVFPDAPRHSGGGQVRVRPVHAASAVERGNKAPEMNGVPLPDGIIPFLADDLRSCSTSRRGRAGRLGVGRQARSCPGRRLRDVAWRLCRRRGVPSRRAVSRMPRGGLGAHGRVARDGLAQPTMIISRDADIMREERAKAAAGPNPKSPIRSARNERCSSTTEATRTI